MRESDTNMERRYEVSSAEAARERQLGPPPQVELLNELQARSRLLGQCYGGALRVLADEQNPDGLAQAAHSTRELLDYLPLAVRDDVPRKPADLTSKVRAVVEDWQRVIGRTASLTEKGWVGEIDEHLRRMLQRIAEFMRWFEVEHPKHGVEQDMILDQFDPANRPLPKQLRDRRGEIVRDLQRYMNGVAHHNFTPTRSEFLQRFTEVEAVLRDLMRPEPLADRKLMDEILKGGQ